MATSGNTRILPSLVLFNNQRKTKSNTVVAVQEFLSVTKSIGKINNTSKTKWLYRTIHESMMLKPLYMDYLVFFLYSGDERKVCSNIFLLIRPEIRALHWVS